MQRRTLLIGSAMAAVGAVLGRPVNAFAQNVSSGVHEAMGPVRWRAILPEDWMVAAPPPERGGFNGDSGLVALLAAPDGNATGGIYLKRHVEGDWALALDHLAEHLAGLGKSAEDLEQMATQVIDWSATIENIILPIGLGGADKMCRFRALLYHGWVAVVWTAAPSLLYRTEATALRGFLSSFEMPELSMWKRAAAWRQVTFGKTGFSCPALLKAESREERSRYCTWRINAYTVPPPNVLGHEIRLSVLQGSGLRGAPRMWGDDFAAELRGIVDLPGGEGTPMKSWAWLDSPTLRTDIAAGRQSAFLSGLDGGAFHGVLVESPAPLGAGAVTQEQRVLEPLRLLAKRRGDLLLKTVAATFTKA